MLEHIGFSYDIANDGNEAIKKYKEAKENRPYSFVIMNLTIPSGMGGLKALEEIKNIDPKVKAIVSSGYSKTQLWLSIKIMDLEEDYRNRILYRT